MIAGVFDSGIGGLTVLKSLLKSNLFEKIIYFGDTARVPYGTKDKNTIIRYSLEALEFFKNFNIDIFIAACNTVSAFALDELKESATCMVVGVIEPGVLALEKKIKDKNANILVLGTKATISSGKYQQLIKKRGYKNIAQVAPSLLVPIVEEGIFKGRLLDEALKYYLSDINKPDVIILGCTHFPLIAKAISNFFGGCELIHSGDAIVEYLKNELKLKEQKECKEVFYFASENPENLKKIASIWLSQE